MFQFVAISLLALNAVVCVHAFSDIHSSNGYNYPVVPPKLREITESRRNPKIEKRTVTLDSLNNTNPYYQKWFTQKVDHFSHTNTATFQQRYWIGANFYKPGGPVIVLEGGETSGKGRLEYMQTGIGRYLTEALGGIGIVLEHRYYGASNVTQNLTTDSLEYLNTAQGLADNANFAENLYKDLPGNLSHIKPSETPFISYGGSYAGAKSAFLQIAYPDTYWGSLASSAVIWAGENFWEYNEPVRKLGDKTCIDIIEKTADWVDTLSAAGGQSWVDFKTLFGVQELEDKDAANTISGVLGIWQEGNWDTNIPGSTDWNEFCANITANVPAQRPRVGKERILAKKSVDDWKTDIGIQNFARNTRASIQDQCGAYSVSDCLGTWNATSYQGTSLQSSWRAWQWQVCTEWGYFTPGAPAGHPTLIPRIVDLSYTRRICQYAFNFTSDFVVNSTAVLQYGGFNLTAPRLMYIDGKDDPWLYATAHSPHSPQQHRHSDLSVLLDQSWHHNDENGLNNIEAEPERIRNVHKLEIDVVRGWVAEFHKTH